jgi:PAS domain S-box-containing protein
MKVNAGLAFLLSGAALLRRGSRDFPLYGLGVLLICTATLTEYAAGIDLRIDQLLFPDPWDTTDPGRMSHITAAGLFILGPGLLLMKAPSPEGRRLSRILGLLSGTIGFIVLLGYVYDTSVLYQIRPEASVAFPAALAFVAAGLGLQCVHPREGIVRQIHADSAGGNMLRRLLPGALLIPFLLGWAGWFCHEHLGWGLGLVMALVIAAIMFCLVSIVLRNAVHLEDRDVTLRGTKEELEEAQRLAQLGSWGWDASKGSTCWSQELYRIHGLDPGLPPPRQQELSKLFTAESWTRLCTAMQQAQETGSVRELDLELIRPNGTKRWVSTRGEPLPDPSGLFVRFRGTVQDITERKLAEERLREYEKAIEAAEEMIAVVDREYRYVIANCAFLNYRGKTREQVIGYSVAEVITPDSFEGIVKEKLDQSFEGKVVRYEMKYSYPGKGERDLSVSYFPIEGSTGVDRVACILQDITERRKQEQAVLESEERFRLMANAAPVLIWMSGPDKLCTYFNQGWLDFTGRPLEAELGNGWADGVNPEDVAECLEIYSQSFDRRSPFEMEYRLRRHDGEYRWLLDRGVPRVGPDGSFTGYIGSCIDITEMKVAEEGLRNLSGKLIEAQEEERKHIARELHDDINQQLALLAIGLEQLKQNPPRSRDQIRNRVQEIANRATLVSKDIQALSHRLHSSKLEYLGLVSAMQGFCGEFSEQHDVEVKFAHQEVPPSLPKDVSLCLFRILQAALANALKHSAVKSFEVVLRGTDRGIHLSVSDTGRGFDLESVLSGRGIGLISMRERARLIKGEISIQSKPNSGTTIDVDVPLSSCNSASRGASVA